MFVRKGFKTYAPEDYASAFRLEFEVPLSFDPKYPKADSDVKDIAFMLAEDLYQGKLHGVDGSLIDDGFYRHKTLDIAVNVETGTVFFGISGAVENPTRYHYNTKTGLPQELENMADFRQNPALAQFVIQIDEKTGAVTYHKSWKPGDCGEFSSLAHILAAGEDPDDYVHFAAFVPDGSTKPKYKKPCDYCQNSAVNKEIVKKFTADLNNNPTNGMNTTDSKNGISRSKFNPRSGCS